LVIYLLTFDAGHWYIQTLTPINYTFIEQTPLHIHCLL